MPASWPLDTGASPTDYFQRIASSQRVRISQSYPAGVGNEERPFSGDVSSGDLFTSA